MRVRRSLLNFGTSALLMGVSMVVALKAAPLIVAWLGEKRWGGYRVVESASGWLGLLELGLGGALGPMLARAIGLNDERALHETVAAGSRAYAAVALAAIAVGLLLTPVVPWFASDLAGPELADLRTAWVVSLAGLPALALLPLRTVVDAKQIGYVINLLILCQSLLITGLSLALANAQWGITGQAMAQVAGVWAFSLALSIGVLRAHPGMLRAVLTARVAPETRRGLWTLSKPSMLLSVSGRVSVLSDNLVMGRVMGAGHITSLVNTQKLITIGQTVLQAVGGATWAALAELHNRGERDAFNRRLVEMTRLVGVLGVIGLVPVVVYNRTFFAIWMGKTDVPYGGDLVTAVAALNAVLLAEQSLWVWVFNATGRNRELVVPAVAAGALNLAASVVLTYWYGLAGPLLGSTVGFLGVGMWAFPWRLSRIFGTPLGDLTVAVVKPLAVGTAAALALRALVGAHRPMGWGGLAAEMSLAALAMTGLSVGLLLSPEDRALWGLRLRALGPVRVKVEP